jgi:hypothetical protein
MQSRRERQIRATLMQKICYSNRSRTNRFVDDGDYGMGHRAGAIGTLFKVIHHLTPFKSTS